MFVGNSETIDEERVAKITPLATRHPTAYVALVVAWVLAGYAMLVGLLFTGVALALLAIAGAVTTRGFAFRSSARAPLRFAGVVTRALWVQTHPPVPPGGVRLTEVDAPELFAEIRRVQTQLDAVAVDEVFVYDALNAAAVQYPRLGVFGWHKNVLWIGLPYLVLLGKDEFRSVLAHELGHLRRNHSRLRNWTLRVRRSWARLVADESHGDFTRGVLMGIVRQYETRFAAMTFVLARNGELDADQSAVTVAGRTAVAAGLVRSHALSAQVVDEFWDRVYGEASTAAEPGSPYLRMIRERAVLRARGNDRETLQQVLQLESTFDCVHPSLADRLSAIGVSSGEATTALLSADGESERHWLGDGLAQIAGRCDEEWRTRVRTSWRKRYLVAEDARALRAAIAPIESLDEDALERTMKIHDWFDENEAALACAAALGSRKPGDRDLELDVLLRRVRLGDAGAAASIAGWFESGRAFDSWCVEEIAGALEANGEPQRAAALLSKLAADRETSARAAQELGGVSAGDTFAPHELTPAQVETLRADLAGCHLSVAYVARRVNRYATETLSHVVVVAFSKLAMMPGLDLNAKVEAEYERLRCTISIPSCFLFHRARHGAIFRAVQAVAKTPVFDGKRANVNLRAVGRDSTASNPARLALGEGALRRMRPELYPSIFGRGRAKIQRTELEVHQVGRLDAGLASAAICLQAGSEVVVAAYSSEIDDVALLRFDRGVLGTRVPEPGQRLIAASVYFAGDELAPDLILGPLGRRVWSNFEPTIADFLSDDGARLAELKAKIAPFEWERVRFLGERKLREFPKAIRDGRPGFARAAATPTSRAA
jgi:Zn-dependent protease with chaperone function